MIDSSYLYSTRELGPRSNVIQRPKDLDDRLQDGVSNDYIHKTLTWVVTNSLVVPVGRVRYPELTQEHCGSVQAGVLQENTTLDVILPGASSRLHLQTRHRHPPTHHACSYSNNSSILTHHEFKGLPDVKRAFAHVAVVRDFAFHPQTVAVGDESRTIL